MSSKIRDDFLCHVKFFWQLTLFWAAEPAHVAQRSQATRTSSVFSSHAKHRIMKAGKNLRTKIKHKIALLMFSYLLQLQLRSEGQESALCMATPLSNQQQLLLPGVLPDFMKFKKKNE